MILTGNIYIIVSMKEIILLHKVFCLFYLQNNYNEFKTFWRINQDELQVAIKTSCNRVYSAFISLISHKLCLLNAKILFKRDMIVYEANKENFVDEQDVKWTLNYVIGFYNKR